MSDWAPHVTVATVIQRDGKYLMVEERDKNSGELVFNQPAGHLEHGETITAAALRCLGGEIQARFRYRSDEERARGARMGHGDEDRVYHTEDLAPGENLVFSATGVTAGDLLEGVRFFGGGARTHSLVMGYQTKQVRFVDTVHMFDRDRPPSVRL